MTVNIAGDVVALPDFDAWPTQTPARRATCTSSQRLHRAVPRVQLRSLGEPALPCSLHVAARRLAASSVSGCCLPNVLGKHPLADFKHPHEQLFGLAKLSLHAACVCEVGGGAERPHVLLARHPLPHRQYPRLHLRGLGPPARLQERDAEVVTRAQYALFRPGRAGALGAPSARASASSIAPVYHCPNVGHVCSSMCQPSALCEFILATQATWASRPASPRQAHPRWMGSG